MKLKNVLRGLKREYDLQEINIISYGESKVYFSGSVNSWDETDADLIPLKKKIEELEVSGRIMFAGRKAFIFISPGKEIETK